MTKTFLVSYTFPPPHGTFGFGATFFHIDGENPLVNVSKATQYICESNGLPDGSICILGISEVYDERTKSL